MSLVNDGLYLFIVIFCKYPPKCNKLTALFGFCMAGVTWNCCRLGARTVYTIQPCTSLQCHFIQSHNYMQGACVFSCNLPQALLAEWPGSFTCYYLNTGEKMDTKISQHRELTLEKKILPPLLQGFEPATFQSRVRRTNHWVMPARQYLYPYWPTKLTKDTS